MNDTPETTSARRRCHDPSLPRYIVDVEIAEKLERERDAARRSAEYMRTSFLKLAGGHPECIQFDWENSGVAPGEAEAMLKRWETLAFEMKNRRRDLEDRNAYTELVPIFKASEATLLGCIAEMKALFPMKPDP